MKVLFDPTTQDAKARYAHAKRRDGSQNPYAPYQYEGSRLRIAINAALATKRPLLLRGEAGAGKSSLAYDVALVLGWTYYERVVSSRMAASDLLWQYDAIERLSDASKTDRKDETRETKDKTKREKKGEKNGVQKDETIAPSKYVRPEVMWWAFAPDRAKKFAKTPDPGIAGDKPGAVLLLDEIDKADPDLPNDLLIPVGDGRFHVRELNDDSEVKRSRDCLIVITSNNERELPAPFLRRCVCQELVTPGKEDLLKIAAAHRPELRLQADTKKEKERVKNETQRADDLITRMIEIRKACKSGQHKPGTAEILDALHACFELGIDTQHADWVALTLAMGWKNTDAPPPSITEKPPKAQQ
jgi:MoxR-like ATPase